MDNVRKAIVKLVYEKQEAHIGSCLSCVEIIQAIKELMKPGDRFILSKAHATRALDVMGRPEGFVKELDCYGGSLGNCIGIGIGIALSRHTAKVYVLVGDGELDEGSSQEALAYIKRENIKGIKVICDYNGWSSYRRTEREGWVEGQNVQDVKEALLHSNIVYAKTTKGSGIPELEDTLESHYHHISKEEYERWTT